MTGQPCRVLVVDDHVDGANATVMLLQMWGHDAMAAYSAEECIATAEAFDPDVVLMDIGLPDKDGFDVNQQLQRLIPGVRVIALTGFTQPDIARRAREDGFVDHLLKPAA